MCFLLHLWWATMSSRFLLSFSFVQYLNRRTDFSQTVAKEKQLRGLMWIDKFNIEEKETFLLTILTYSKRCWVLCMYVCMHSLYMYDEQSIDHSAFLYYIVYMCADLMYYFILLYWPVAVAVFSIKSVYHFWTAKQSFAFSSHFESSLKTSQTIR